MHTHGTLRQQLLKQTKEQIAAAVTPETLIIQAIGTVEQLDMSVNSLAKKAREWYALTFPELEHLIRDHEKFLTLVTSKSQKELATEFSLKQSMGGELSKQDAAALQAYLASITALARERDALLAYVAQLMERACPNITVLAGATIGAKLLRHAGSLEKLATVPSSTLQLYGAETALFRHLKNKKQHRSPKYGILFAHPMVQRATEKGKAARVLADKLSLCARLDHFKGELKAPDYKKELGERFAQW